MLKLLRTLPKVLKYMPMDKAQDARNFMLSFQYWLGGSSDNLENFLLMLADKYVRSEEHTSELQSLTNLVCRLLLEKKKKNKFVLHAALCV